MTHELSPGAKLGEERFEATMEVTSVKFEALWGTAKANMLGLTRQDAAVAFDMPERTLQVAGWCLVL